MSNYNDANTLDFLNDDEGLIMAALCMVTVVWDRYREVDASLSVEGSYAMRSVAKAFGYIGQVIDEDLSHTGELQEINASCWEALDCCDFDHEYQDKVLDFFVGEGAEWGQKVADNPEDTAVLYEAGEALRESFLETIEAYIEGYGEDYDGQPDEAQEWHDFDPDC